MSNRIRNATYWVTTILGPTSFVIGGVIHLTQADQATVTLAHLGIPLISRRCSACGKLGGAIVLTIPGLPRLKEWAYAVSSSISRQRPTRARPSGTALPTSLRRSCFSRWSWRHGRSGRPADGLVSSARRPAESSASRGRRLACPPLSVLVLGPWSLVLCPGKVISL
jgi:hypothetical protein